MRRNESRLDGLLMNSWFNYSYEYFFPWRYHWWCHNASVGRHKQKAGIFAAVALGGGWRGGDDQMFGRWKEQKLVYSIEGGLYQSHPVEFLLHHTMVEMPFHPQGVKDHPRVSQWQEPILTLETRPPLSLHSRNRFELHSSYRTCLVTDKTSLGKSKTTSPWSTSGRMMCKHLAILPPEVPHWCQEVTRLPDPTSALKEDQFRGTFFCFPILQKLQQKGIVKQGQASLDIKSPALL